MQNAAQSLLQLMGAKGYRLNHVAGRSVVDSRPFQIFEGSNDILYQQISESVLKKMRKFKTENLYEFLNSHSLTQNATDYLKELLNFKVDTQMAQHRLVELGRVISRIISMEYTLHLNEKGFNKELIQNTIDTLRADVEQMMTRFQNSGSAVVVENYQESSSWFDFVGSKQLVHT